MKRIATGKTSGRNGKASTWGGENKVIFAQKLIPFFYSAFKKKILSKKIT